MGPPEIVRQLSVWHNEARYNNIAFGYLKIKRPGEYGFYANAGFSRCTLYVNGENLKPFGGGREEIVHRITLPVGLVPFAIASYVLNDHVDVQWQPPGQVELGPIPSDALLHDPANKTPDVQASMQK